MRYRDDRGIGLMEIIVAISLMGVAAFIVAAFMMSSAKVTTRTATSVASQSQLLDALSRVTRDIAVANPIIEAKADSLTVQQVRDNQCLRTTYSAKDVNGTYALVSTTYTATGSCPAMDVAMTGTPSTDTVVAGLSAADGQPVTGTLNVFTYYDASNQTIAPTGPNGTVDQPNRIQRVGIALSAKPTGRPQGVTLSTSMAPRSGLANASEPRPSDTPPAAPTMSPPSIVGCVDSVDLNWTAVPGATGYMILRDGTSVATLLASDGTTYTDHGLEYGRTYSYEVYAQTTAGITPPGTAQTVTRCPAAPHLTGQVTVANGDGALNDDQLTWSRPSGTVTYIIYRNGTPLKTINSATTLTYTDLNRPWSTTDHYTITAVNAGGESAPSNDLPLLTVPAAPSLSGVVNGATNTITLTVTPATASDGYHIWLSNGTKVATLTAPTTSWTVTEPWGSTTQWYATAYNATGDSLLSGQVAGTIRPSAPALSGSVSNVTTSNLSWTKPAGATEFRLFRNGTQIYQGPNTSYADTNRPNGVTDVYVVYAVDYHLNYPTATPVNGVTGFGGGVSDPSNTQTLTIAPAAVTVNGRMCLCRDANRPQVTWSAASGATQYKILRDGSWVATVAAPATAFNETSYSTPGGGWVTYQVIANNAGGDSPASNTTSLQAKPDTPGIGASPTGEYGTNVWWNAENGATNYYVLRDGVGVYWGGATSWHDPNTVPGWKYVYRVFAVNNTGYSGSSATQVVQGTGSNLVEDPNATLSFTDPQNGMSPDTSTAGEYRINWMVAFCIDLSSHGAWKSGGYSGWNWYWPWSGGFVKQDGWDSSYNGGYMWGPNTSYDEVARLAYALSKYGMPTDVQKTAALDAFVRTQTDAGGGVTRANERYANMTAQYGWISAWYNQISNEAYAYGGPYGFTAYFNGTPAAGQATQVVFRVWSTRTGNGVPNLHLAIHLDSQENLSTSLTTDGGGWASIWYTPDCSGTVGVSWAVDDMPSSHVELAFPNDSTAQRMITAFPEVAYPAGASANAN